MAGAGRGCAIGAACGTGGAEGSEGFEGGAAQLDMPSVRPAHIAANSSRVGMASPRAAFAGATARTALS